MPKFNNLRPRRVREREFKSASIAYDRIINGTAVLFDDTQRTRFGKFRLDEFIDKNKGYTVMNTISGGTGGGKGGLLFEDPSPTGTDRKRLIYANLNIVYLYSVENETRVLLRDIGTVDSDTITYLSGVQMKGNAYFVIGDDTSTAKLYKYAGTSSGAFSAFADYSGTVAGTVKGTDVAHGLQTGNEITIAGTTSYNGTFTITKIDADNFYFTDTWVANDATGTWSGETLTLETATGLTDGRIIGQMTDRICVAGVDDRADVVQYSYLSATAAFTNFTSSSTSGQGGNFDGVIGQVTALAYTKGVSLAFERNRITAHVVDDAVNDGGGALIKDTKDLQEEITITGTGVASQKAVTIANDLVVFVTESDGIWVYDPISRRAENRLKELTKDFSPQLANFVFTDASVAHDKKRNQLIVTCSSTAGIGADTLLMYDFETKTWSRDEGKRTNQVFYDDINEKVFGLSSTGGSVHELFPDSYTDNDQAIELIAETKMDNLGDASRNKRFISASIRLGAENTSQQFTISAYLDDEPSVAFTETVTVSELAGEIGGGLRWWSGSSWSGSSPVGDGQVGYVTYFYDRFIRDFERISWEVKESSSLRSVVRQPIVSWSATDDKLDSFR